MNYGRMAAIVAALLANSWAIRDVAATEYSHNVSFNAVAQNPWTGGPAFTYEYHNTDFKFDFDVDLPPIDADPAGAALDLISGFLGFDLPGLGLKMGAHAEGHAMLDFGYYVTGGYLDMKYPGRARLDVQTIGATNNVSAIAPFRIESSFDAGVSAISTPTTMNLGASAGNGYNTPATNMSFEHYSTPQFATTFPYASAWANLNYQVAAGGYIEAEYIFDSLRKEYNFSSQGEVTLVEADPTGISVAGLPSVDLFDQEIDLGLGAKLIIGNPNLKVQSTGLQSDNSLHGYKIQPIITLQGDLEKLVPAIGPLLSNSIGPIGYDLLNLSGGPRLNLYQDFTFTPDPHVRLDFSEPVRFRANAGEEYQIGDSVTFRLGDGIDVQAIPGNTDTFTVKPTYLLNNTFRNQTGVSLGAVLDVDILELETPFGDFGPLYSGTLSFDDLIQIPFFDSTFSLALAPVSVAPMTFHKTVGTVLAGASAAQITQTGVHSIDPDTNSEIWDFHYHGPVVENGPDVDFTFQVSGQKSLVIGTLTGLANKVLKTSADVIVYDPETGLPLVNIGRDFSENVPIDLSAFTPTDFSMAELNDPSAPTLYLSRMDVDPSALPGAFDPSLDPTLGANNSVANTVFSSHTGETYSVPEPSTFVLGALGALGLAAAGIGRRSH